MDLDDTRRSGSTCIAEGLSICGRLSQQKRGMQAGVKQASASWLASGA